MKAAFIHKARNSELRMIAINSDESATAWCGDIWKSSDHAKTKATDAPIRPWLCPAIKYFALRQRYGEDLRIVRSH